MSNKNLDYQIGEKVKWKTAKFSMIGCFISDNGDETYKVITHTINGQLSGR
jgi:hypothetical protein